MSKLDELMKVLNYKDNIFIQMHNSPDPDAIATAFALEKLLKVNGIESTICYIGQIEKYSTLRMIELLNIDIVYVENPKDISKDSYIILVDSQKYNSNITDFQGIEVACIDHHPIFVDIDYKFKDIRMDVGACSSIIASYYVENNIEISQNVATALLYGIKVDTLDLSRGVNNLDLDMFYFLYKKADISKLNNIQRNTLEYKDLTAYGSAIENIRIYGNVGFVNIGLDCPDVLLACVSDFILSLKEVVFVIVYCEKEDGMKFSIRNEDDELDAGIIVNKALAGYGNGGGHKTMAGGVIPRKNMNKLSEKMDNFLEAKFLENIKKYTNLKL